MNGRTAGRSHVAVRVTVRSDQEDVATGLLWDLGPSGLEILGDDGSGGLPIVAYFPTRTGILDEVRARLAALASSVEQVALRDVDWAASFRQSFSAFSVGPFRVVPCWEPRPADVGHVLVVDPGRAFGTGTHETTRLCLTLIAELSTGLAPLRVLDVGTGTGILAIAALACGARQSVAIDNDVDALTSAREHARLNDVRLDLLLADGARALQPGRFELIVANLMAPLLIAMRDDLAALRTRDGQLVLSGLLATDVEEISTAFGDLGRLDVRLDGEWAAVAVLP